MGTGPKGQWGGRRPNQTGRPKKYSESDKLRRALLRKGKEWEKKFGQSVDDVLLMLIYSKDINGIPVEVQDKTKAAAIKIYKEYTMVRESNSNVTVKDERPAMRLPEMKADPGKVFVKEGNA